MDALEDLLRYDEIEIMRVRIGPYRHAKKLKNGEWKDAPDRTIQVEIEKFDTWSMDHTLALIIHPMLVQLKASIHGAPNTDDADVPEHLRSTLSSIPKTDVCDTDEFHFDRWNWILDEMIWAFEQTINDDGDEQFYTGESHILWQPLDNDRNPIGEPQELSDEREQEGVLFYQMINGPKHTLKVDREGLDKHYDRMQNGYVLFGKYYRGLWD
jgi:hypothetical protein